MFSLNYGSLVVKFFISLKARDYAAFTQKKQRDARLFKSYSLNGESPRFFTLLRALSLSTPGAWLFSTLFEFNTYCALKSPLIARVLCNASFYLGQKLWAEEVGKKEVWRKRMIV